MGMYERRDRPAYSPLKADDKWGNNSHILSWWKLKHDQALEIMVLKWQWVWYWQAADAIVNVTPAETLDKWRGIDPICNKYDWRNVLMYFAAARAAKTNITKNIRPAKLKKCPLCENPFV